MAKIKIGGEERPVKYTLNAVIEFEEITGIDMTKGSPDFTRLKSLRALCFVGLKHGAKSEGKPFENTLEEVGEWLGASDSILIDVMNVFKKDTGSGKEPDDTEPSEPEKK